MNQTCDSAAHL